MDKVYIVDVAKQLCIFVSQLLFNCCKDGAGNWHLKRTADGKLRFDWVQRVYLPL